MSRPGAPRANKHSVAVIFLLAAAECLADAPTEPGVDASSAKPAPNQSVSIETAAEGPSAGSDNAAERTLAASRIRRRPALGDLAEGDRSTPWYRTGIGALAVVLAVVGAAFWVVRRWIPSSRPADGGVMTIVGRASLTPKHSLALVRVGRRYVMVGVSADRLDSLCDISDSEEVAELAARIGLGQTAPGSFDTLLAGETSDYRELPPLAADSTAVERERCAAAPSSLTTLLGRLRTMQPK